MELILEIVLWIVAGLILEPLVFWVADRVKPKPDAGTVEVDPKNFTLRYSRDMKALYWVIAGLIGLPAIGLMIAAPFMVERENLN